MERTRLIHSHDLEIAFIVQKMILQEDSTSVELPLNINTDLSAYGMLRQDREVFAEAASIHQMMVLELIGAHDVDSFRLSKFAALVGALSPSGIVNQLFGSEVVSPSDGTTELVEQFAGVGIHLRALTVQYLLEHGKSFLEALQTLMLRIAEAVPASAFIAADKAADEFSERIKVDCQVKEPLLLSEELMGKRFRNRGPYENFFLVPTFFGETVRIFQKQQVLFVKVPKQPIDEVRIAEMWKAIADPTRDRILQLLANRGPSKAVDLVGEVGLSAPTVSHHLDVLRQAGMIHIEPAGRAKYYSVNVKAIKHLQMALDRLIL